MLNKDQIVEFLSGTSNLESLKKLKAWVGSDENNRKYFSAKKNLWVATGINKKRNSMALGHEFELLNLRMKDSTGNSEKPLKLEITGKPNKNFAYYFLRIAAALLLFYSLGISVYYLGSTQKIEYSEVTTQKGEKTKLVLADGTRIWLNAASTLRYPNKLDKGEINMYLNGEAFFDVTKKNNRKLNVNTSNIRIQVLGTSFNVKSYDEDDHIETTLVRGSILIDGKIENKVIEGPILLKPNQQATFTKGAKDFRVKRVSEKDETAGELLSDEKTNTERLKPSLTIFEKVEVNDFTAWKDHVLVFKSESLSDLSKKMERWYNVEININDATLKNSRYTGIFEKETIEQAMEALSLSLPFDYTIDKNEITIKAKKNS
jgi:ferric-dicitrate binding protein FerR (iron transport regulator)